MSVRDSEGVTRLSPCHCLRDFRRWKTNLKDIPHRPTDPAVGSRRQKNPSLCLSVCLSVCLPASFSSVLSLCPPPPSVPLSPSLSLSLSPPTTSKREQTMGGRGICRKEAASLHVYLWCRIIGRPFACQPSIHQCAIAGNDSTGYSGRLKASKWDSAGAGIIPFVQNFQSSAAPGAPSSVNGQRT